VSPLTNCKKTALPELLAPAGSPEALRAAVAAGADAVYLSGKRFGARKYAANFSDTEIEDAVRYAHSYGIRVYVTVNTLIHDRELDGVLEYLSWLWSIGVDAILVQDTGLAALAREYLPGLVIHASTQMTIHNSDGIRWAAEQGLSRVVLARELSLNEVERIAEETKDTGTGLEVFAHGALCYGYSGQCLLSSVIGGRSGNRGMCAQPCRKPYALVQGETDLYGRPENLTEVTLKEKYLLSPKDLCTYQHLPDLVKSLVASLKIEGRMKSPEYVTMVVSTYRRALDAIAAGTWEPSREAYRDFLLAFNREFTDGYLFGDRYGKLMGRDAPDNRGLAVGRVERYDRKSGTAFVRPSCPVTPVPGDGLLITLKGAAGQDLGFALNAATTASPRGYRLPVPAPVPEGALVYITSSPGFDARARRILAKPPADLLRPLSADMEIAISSSGSVAIDGTVTRPDGKTIPVSYRPEKALEPATTRPLTAGQLEEQFRKTGGTPFIVGKCTIWYDGGLFAPMALLNDMRREFFRRAGELLDASYRPSPEDIAKVQDALKARKSGRSHPAQNVREVAGRLRVAVITDTPDSVIAARDGGADAILFEPAIPSERHTCGSRIHADFIRMQIREALEACRDTRARFILKLPRILHDGELEKFLDEIRDAEREGLAACMSENPGTSHAIVRACPGIALHGGAGLNIFNHAAATRSVPQYRLLTLSSELSRTEIAELTASAAGYGEVPEFALIVQGSSEALVTEDCIARMVRQCRGDRGGFLALRDETGRVFPLHEAADCRTRIANAAELCLIDMLPEIRDAGITEVVIDARFRPAAYTTAITRLYREAVDAIGAGSRGNGKLRDLKDRAKTLSLGGITAGHFIRGLKE
jgi:putative protease